MGIIRIQDLKLKAFIGVTAEERSFPSILHVDLALHLDTNPAAASDDISATCDYDLAISLIKETCYKSSSALLESLARKCARVLFEEFSILDLITIEIKKDIFTDVRSVSVLESFKRDDV